MIGSTFAWTIPPPDIHSQQPETPMVVLERHYRVLVDVVVEMSALPELDVRGGRTAAPCHTWQPDPLAAQRDNQAAQERLLHALLRSSSELDAWFRREAVRHVLDSGLDSFRIDTDEEELLRPVIACLPPPDREFFQDAIESEEFCEVADPFLEATSARMIGVSVTDGAPMPPGSSQTLALRAYRVGIDMEVTIQGIDEPQAELRWLTLHEACGCELEVTPDRFARLQSSLLTTLQACEEELDAWLRQEVLREIVDYGDEVDVPELTDREILGPVISGLDAADRLRFEALLDDGTLYEGARAFYRAVTASTREVTIAAMPNAFPDRWQTRDPQWPAQGPPPAPRRWPAE